MVSWRTPRNAGAPHPGTQGNRHAIGARPGGVDDWSISPEERVALGPQPPNYPPPLSRAGASEPHDLDHTLCRAGAPQPRDVDDVTAWPGRHCCQRLVDTLIMTASKEVWDFMIEAHRPTITERAELQATWQHGSFSKVLHTLKLSYASHLKQCLNNEWKDEHAKTVRDLADLIKAKLDQHCDADVAQLGAKDLQEMLEHFQDEFRWQTCAEVFEACANKARREKATSYAKAVHAEKRLKERRADPPEPLPKRRRELSDTQQH